MTADHGQTEGIGQDTAHCDTGDLLVRRSPGSGELAFYLCWSPRAAPLAELVKVAGARWAIEECFQAAKNEAALDHYQVRKHVAWYRHVTLAPAAQAWLAAAAARPPGALPGSGPGEGGRARKGAGDLWTTSRPAAALE